MLFLRRRLRLLLPLHHHKHRHARLTMNDQPDVRMTHRRKVPRSMGSFYFSVQHSMSIPDDRKSTSRPAPSLSPKLAYSYSNIEENLQCPLCLDRLRDPRALPCQHVFCCSCLKSIPSSNVPFPTIVCPLCRRTFPYNSADQFPVSYIHRQLLELIPKNYDVNGKCTKCQDKTSLTLCSCCDFLLCQKCFSNDRQKILDNIEHITQTCRFRVKRIDMTYHQILKLNQTNQRIIEQVQTAYENFERKYTEHKQSILHQLHQHNDDINRMFWSKLNLPTTSTTETFTQILDQADLIMQKSQTVQFEDILSLFYNLTSINEQLEQANTSIDTPKIQNLLKQDMQINFDEQLSVQLNQNNQTDKTLALIPPTILPRSIKRLRKTEPKRHIEQIDDDDNEDQEDCVFEDSTCLSKRMKSEYEEENLISPISSIFSSNIETQGNEINDDDIIFMGSYHLKSPATPNLEELLQIISTND